MPGSPLAYFITFRTYGTWLQGDARGWTVAGDQPGAPLHAPHRGFAGDAHRRMRDGPFVLDTAGRQAVERSMRETCALCDWDVFALNVRPNHVHIVLRTPGETPEPVMTALKRWATRALRAAGMVGADRPVWSRHGSTKYLWTERAIEDTAAYVLYGQDGRGAHR